MTRNDDTQSGNPAQINAAAIFDLMADLREARTKKLGLVRNGKRDLALTSLINELDQRVMELPAATLRQLAEQVRQQAAQLAEAQAGGWVSVQERLPEVGTPILVWSENEKTCREATYEYWDEDDYRFCGRNYADVLNVAFWQKLPAPPVQEASDGE